MASRKPEAKELKLDAMAAANVKVLSQVNTGESVAQIMFQGIDTQWLRVLYPGGTGNLQTKLLTSPDDTTWYNHGTIRHIEADGWKVTHPTVAWHSDGSRLAQVKAHISDPGRTVFFRLYAWV